LKKICRKLETKIRYTMQKLDENNMTMEVHKVDLVSFTTNSLRNLDMSFHDRNTVCVDGTKASICEQSYKERF
jgi:hypothetical protein